MKKVEKVEENPKIVGASQDNVTREARMLIEKGEQLEALGENLRWLPDRWPYVYNIQCRAAIRDNAEAMLLVKAVGEGGPLIAFHSSLTIAGALATYAARARAGKVKWKEDEYPPKNYAEISAGVIDQVEHVRKTWWGRSQGSTDNDNASSTKAEG